MEFAARTMRSYRTAVLQDGRGGRPFHLASLPQHRRGFIESYCVFKRYRAIAERELRKQ
jgi:hypothetical protein